MAEYDGCGVCLREYINIGEKMVAEYQPATGRYFYYTTDQINSTRVVADDNGNVVYASVHDPYGGIHHTWVNNFNPELKFSGKEQDAESGLYYFDARYYDPTLYRFLSPDPVIPNDMAIYNPQRWNLYGYCLGDPINFVDIEGERPESHRKLTITRTIYTATGVYGHFRFEGKYFTVEGVTLELPEKNNSNFVSCIPEGNYPAIPFLSPTVGFTIRLLKTGPRTLINVHPGTTLRDTEGCPLVGKSFDNKGNLRGGGEAQRVIAADYALDHILSTFLGLNLTSKETHKTEVKIEQGSVSCEARVIGFVVSTPWYDIFYFL
ncbi:MAG: DUF5675 family protein [Candidatus Saccharicenans sp.]|nr:DUF5675 family protein [Candidatus Saccharicenans sp.]